MKEEGSHADPSAARRRPRPERCIESSQLPQGADPERHVVARSEFARSVREQRVAGIGTFAAVQHRHECPVKAPVEVLELALLRRRQLRGNDESAHTCHVRIVEKGPDNAAQPVRLHNDVVVGERDVRVGGVPEGPVAGRRDTRLGLVQNHDGTRRDPAYPGVIGFARYSPVVHEHYLEFRIVEPGQACDRLAQLLHRNGHRGP